MCGTQGKLKYKCRCVGIGRRPRLKIVWRNPCGFESHHRHQNFQPWALRFRAFLLPNDLYSGVLRVKRKDRICRRDLATVIQVGVDVGSRSNITVSQPFLDFLQTDAVCVKQAGTAVPLRYNNDKRKKPLFSRGLSVCRHLFNSFSKLKCDEKIIEKRRLFH